MKNYYNEIDNIINSDKEGIRDLLENCSREDIGYAAAKARSIAEERFGKKIFLRGIVEISNICKNNCLYCGIRRDNNGAVRYRMSNEEIFLCCEEGYEAGIRTFVLQGGEDGYFTDERMCGLISQIREKYPDCAITLSLGERSENSYRKMFEAGADRYLLRHETADPVHYGRLHPQEMSFQNRIDCLRNLKKIGYQTGCGMMVGSPYQTCECLAEDLIFLRKFQPEMVGIGPFLPSAGTPFEDQAPGSAEQTLFLVSLVRLMLPNAMIPATTALGVSEEGGRIKGILCGANVVMPNLSPRKNREKYMLYNKKAELRDDAKSVISKLKSELHKEGYEIVIGRGDYEEKAE